MATALPPRERTVTMRDELLSAGLLYPSGVTGVYLRSAEYQAIADAIGAAVSRWAATREPVVMYAPPVLTRATFAKTNYLESFPDLMGSVHTFGGDDRAHRELLRRVEAGQSWSDCVDPSELVLAPAACHPVYPLCAGGRVLEGGRYFDVRATCFRHEPSEDVTRMQSFQMHELVHVGGPEASLAHRDDGLAEGLELLGRIGLDVRPVAASDPFFGRVGTLLAGEQLAEQLKIEGVATIAGADMPTAVMSANYHKDHFGDAFHIIRADGERAHSACVAFGIDRITVALLDRHGFRSSRWPASVRAQLWP